MPGLDFRFAQKLCESRTGALRLKASPDSDFRPVAEVSGTCSGSAVFRLQAKLAGRPSSYLTVGRSRPLEPCHKWRTGFNGICGALTRKRVLTRPERAAKLARPAAGNPPWRSLSQPPPNSSTCALICIAPGNLISGFAFTKLPHLSPSELQRRNRLLRLHITIAHHGAPRIQVHRQL